MKKILVLFAIVSVIGGAANAVSTVVGGGFGTDGATLNPIPHAKSVEEAAKVYQALSTKPSANGKKTIETQDGEFSCKKPNSGMHTKTAGCEFTFSGKIAWIIKLVNQTNVTFNGDIAEAIRMALPKDTGRRVGVDARSAANLSCRKVLGQKAECTLTNVAAVGAVVGL